jgi:hypothetical protein
MRGPEGQQGPPGIDGQQGPPGATGPEGPTAPRLGVIPATVTNWDDAWENGWYMGYSAYQAPDVGWWVGEVICHNSDWVTQRVWSFTDSLSAVTQVWVRRSSAGSPKAWGPWLRDSIMGAGAATLAGTLTVNNPNGDPGLTIIGSSATGYAAYVDFRDAQTTQAWRLYKLAADPNWYFRDLEYGSMALRLGPGGVNSSHTFTGRVTFSQGIAGPGVPYAMAVGVVSVALSGVSAGFSAFTLPVGRFSQVPIFAVNQPNAAGGTQTLVPRVINATTSGASAYLYSGNNTVLTVTSSVQWTATQMTSGSSPGIVMPLSATVIDATVTCHTVGCENEGHDITLSVEPDVTTIVCGVCGTDISGTRV